MSVTYARLWDGVNQFSLKSGALNVAGRVIVRYEGTDDLADLYDENHTRLSNPVVLDNDGRAMGVFVDAARLYWIDVQDRYGSSQFTVRKMTPVGSSGLGNAYDVISSDGSIYVDKYEDNGTTTFDLSVAEDDVNRLDWIRCEGSRLLACSDIYLPVYADGPMEVGSVGVRLGAGKYYHVTAHVRATKSAVSPWYDRVFVVLSQKFPTGPDTVITNQSFVVDGSMELVQDFEVSCDTMVESDCELKIEIVGDLNNVTYAVTDLEIHRVYSGVAQGGGGSGPVEQVQSDWAEIDTEDPSYIRHKPETKPVVAGDGIIITETTTEFTISATAAQEQVQSDWTENDTEDPSYIKHKPTLATVATTGDYDDLTNKPTIPAAQVNSNWTATSGVAAILNKPTLATVATSGDYNDLSNKPSIPADKVYIFWDMGFNRSEIRAAIEEHKVIMDWDRTSNEHRFFTKYEEKVIDGNLCELYHFAHIETDYETPFATTWRLGDMCYIYDTVRQIQYAEHDTKLFDHEVPSPTSADAGKVLTAAWDPDQAAGSWSWQTASTPAVDQTYNSASTNAQSGTAVAGALATINQVPASTSADEDKVLTVDSNGEPVWATSQGGGSTYTAGDGIEIDANNEISAKVDGTTITVNASGELEAIGGTGSQVQANWAETDPSDPSYIENKPSIPTATSDLTNDSGFITTSDVPSSQEQADWNESDSSDPAYIKNKPSIPAAQVNSDWTASSGVAQILNKPTLATVATTGDYADLTNKPTIPSVPVQDVTVNGTSVVSNGTAAVVVPAQAQADWNESNTSDPSYIKNKPTIPSAVTVDQTYNSASTNPQSGTAVAGALATVNQVPSSTSSDEDKVLTVNSSGTPVWATPQGGGSTYTAGDGIDIDTNNVISAKVDGTSVVVNAAGELVAVGVSGSQVQADWTETDASDPSYIQNKPTIPAAVTVDQTYGSSSTNAQSGTAVAGALDTIKTHLLDTSNPQGNLTNEAFLASILSDLQSGRIVMILKPNYRLPSGTFTLVSLLSRYIVDGLNSVFDFSGLDGNGDRIRLGIRDGRWAFYY